MIIRFAGSVFLGITLLAAPLAHAQTTASEITRALTKTNPKPLTRGLTARPNNQGQATLNRLRTRAMVVESKKQRQEVAAAIEQMAAPSINISVNFAYNSANISPASVATLNELGLALLDPALVNSSLVLNGHTDAAGSDIYNQQLSQRRANAVKAYLQSRFHIADHRLIAIGFGEERLLNTYDPLAAENRRVEVVNIGDR